MYPTGTVFHPGRVSSLVGSFNLPLVFGRPVIVVDRYIHIFVPRRAQRWTVHWSGNRIRRSPRLRRVTIDTARTRRVVGDGIFAPRGRVVYTAGPRVNRMQHFGQNKEFFLKYSQNHQVTYFLLRIRK